MEPRFGNVGPEAEGVDALPRYAVVTAARNEEAYIEQTLRSVVSQTVKPLKWVIVSDGSTDQTDEIVSRYALQHRWIELLSVQPDPTRNFGSKAKAIQAGYEKVRGLAFDYVAILDADISFGPTYYEKLLEHLMRDPDLGLAGGRQSDFTDGKFIRQDLSMDWSVSGGVQTFRRECYDGMGGYRSMRRGGVDTVAEIMVRMQGKKVRTFPELEVLHHRRTGAEKSGPALTAFHDGVKEYAYGTHFLFEAAKCVRRIGNPPRVVGSLLRMAGYLSAFLRREPIPLPRDVIRFERAEQLQRLGLGFLAAGRKTVEESAELPG